MQRVKPFYGRLLIDRLVTNNRENPKPHAFDTPFRHSDGGGCMRKQGFKAARVPESDPFDAPSSWVAYVGTLAHEDFQDEADKLFGTAAVPEVAAHDANWLTSGSSDLTHDVQELLTEHLPEGCRVCVEMKTVNGTQFARTVGIYKRGFKSKRTTATGPKPDHIIQLALNTIEQDCDFGVLFYNSTEALSIQTMLGVNRMHPDDPLDEYDRVTAEWLFTREELWPIAEAEYARLTEAKLFADKGLLHEAVAVGDTLDEMVTVSPHGEEPSWNCLYCSYFTICKNYPPGNVPFRPSDLEVRSAEGDAGGREV